MSTNKLIIEYKKDPIGYFSLSNIEKVTIIDEEHGKMSVEGIARLSTCMTDYNISTEELSELDINITFKDLKFLPEKQ